jgi:cytochrome c peroxidase
MKKQFVSAIIFGITVVSGFVACTPEDVQPKRRVPVLPEEVYDYTTPVTPTFFEPFGDSAINNHVATLGRVLFYDQQLSANYRVSCGSCHRQQFGFADNKTVSPGFENDLTHRNTQTIVNTGTQRGFFWDLREEILDHMVLQPIANHVEMGLDDTLLMENRVSSIDYYQPLFENAFGSNEVTTHKIGLALAQFVKSIISVSTKYDEGATAMFNQGVTGNINHRPFPNFTDQENFGKHVFFLKFPCSQCHGGVNLDGSLSAPKNIGLDVDYSDDGMLGTDFLGRVRDGFFKTPSLRNVQFTAPYMHDGRFQTLEEVIEFYDAGIQPHPLLSEELRWREQGGLTFEHLGPVIPFDQVPTDGRVLPVKMFMTGEEKAALVAFLKTLTDYQTLSDPKFSDPFQVVD